MNKIEPLCFFGQDIKEVGRLVTKNPKLAVVGILHACKGNQHTMLEFLVSKIKSLVAWKYTINNLCRFGILAILKKNLQKVLARIKPNDLDTWMTQFAVQAIKGNQLNTLKFLLDTYSKQGLTTLSQNLVHNRLIWIVFRRKNTSKDIIRYFLDEKLFCNWSRAFYATCVSGSFENTMFVVGCNDKFNIDETHFRASCKGGNTEVMEFVFSKLPKDQMPNYDRAFVYACWSENIKAVQWVLSKGKTIGWEIPNATFLTGLFENLCEKAPKRSWQVVQFLFRYYIPSPQGDSSLLKYACRTEDIRTIKCLIYKNPNKQLLFKAFKKIMPKSKRGQLFKRLVEHGIPGNLLKEIHKEKFANLQKRNVYIKRVLSNAFPKVLCDVITPYLWTLK